jgi:phenylpropionate dioxygenase-like ring-hydroxylating dioxygenase large terminal subunit
MQEPALNNQWHPVALAESLVEEVPLGVRLLGIDIVVWRLEGDLLAWRDICLHRGTKLSLGSVKDGCLVCPYHGWSYDRTGQCVKIPAHPDQTPPQKAKATSFHCRERYGLIWVALGSPKQDIAIFKQAEDSSFRLIPCGPYLMAASAPRVVENFLDVAHFPFVHDGLLGDSDAPEIGDYQVETDEDGITASDISVYQPDPDGTGVGKRITYTYTVPRPLVATFKKEAEGPQFSMYLAVCPEEELVSRAFFIIAMNYGFEIPVEQLRGFQDRIVAQDKPIVESQRPELLPLDLAEELHLRSDRTAIAYRKWLKELGLRFGTA